MKLHFETSIQQSKEEVKARFGQDLFNDLCPPGVELNILRFDGCQKGDEIHLEVKLLGKTQNWVSLITEESDQTDEWFFVDEGAQLPWPLSRWHHKHRVVRAGENSCKIIDEIQYECSPEWLGPLVAPGLWLIFAIRPYRYQRFFRKKA